MWTEILKTLQNYETANEEPKDIWNNIGTKQAKKLVDILDCLKCVIKCKVCLIKY